MAYVTNKRKQNDSESQAPLASTKAKKNDEKDDRFGPVLSTFLPTIFSLLDWKTLLSVAPLISKEWKMCWERDELWGPHFDKISYAGDLLTEELPKSTDLLLFPLDQIVEPEPEIPGESRRSQFCSAYRQFVLCEDYWTCAKDHLGTLPDAAGDVDVDVFEDFQLPMGLKKLASRILSAPGANHLNYCYHMLEV
jgi:hypothetical protein